MFSNLKLGTRLAFVFALLFTLITILGGTALWKMRGLSANTTYFVENIVPSLEVQHQISAGLADIRRLQYMHVASNSGSDMDKIETDMAASHKTLDALFERYAKDLLSDDEDKRDMNVAHDALGLLDKDWSELRPVSRRTSTDPSQSEIANKMLTGDGTRDYAGVQAAISVWRDYNVKLGALQASEAAANAAQRRWIIGGLVCAALLICIATGWRITRSLTRQLGGEPSEAAQLAHSVAEGDLTTDVKLRAGDTHSVMAALKSMQTNLVEVVSKVRSNSESVATASSQIAQGNQDLSQRTEEQASALQETAASMEQLSATVKHNAANAVQGNQLALAASAVAVRGGEVVGQVVGTMKSINESSKKISDIISVIDGIAFQTNILALNAAVEAARAGEQGRGFAVVATEVRNLAGRSADAAKEIKSLINSSVERVEQGTALVDQAGETMSEVVGSIRRVTDIMGEISAASAEQSSGVTQVGTAVSQMDQVTQQNAALVEESAAAAESLKTQAQQLVQAVAVFKLSQAEMRSDFLPRRAPGSLDIARAAIDAAKQPSSSKANPTRKDPVAPLVKPAGTASETPMQLSVIP